MNINIQRLNETVEAAKAKAPTWAHKIDHAAEILLSNPFIHDTGDGLLILSDSGNIYHANGACQCKAFQFGQVCWHRTAAQLVKRYNGRTQ